MSTFIGLHAWITAWEAAMAEAGYPKARLDPEMESVTSMTYTWTDDIEEPSGTQEGWNTAHRAFLAVDDLRPWYVTPSIVLAEMISGTRERP